MNRSPKGAWWVGMMWWCSSVWTPPPLTTSSDKPPALQPTFPFSPNPLPSLVPIGWLPTGTSLPPRECVASSSDSPPINRYSTFSCALTLPDVNVLYPCCLPSVWFPGSKHDRIYISCVYSSVGCMCWKCPCGWRGFVYCFFQCSLSYLISPLVFFPLPPPTPTLRHGLSGVGLMVRLCAAVSSICHISCTSMRFSDGVDKHFTLFGPLVTSQCCSGYEEP